MNATDADSVVVTAAVCGDDEDDEWLAADHDDNATTRASSSSDTDRSRSSWWTHHANMLAGNSSRPLYTCRTAVDDRARRDSRAHEELILQNCMFYIKFQNLA